MDALPSLLSRALRLCNTHGNAITFGVCLFGGLALLFQIFFWHQVTAGTALELKSILGDKDYAAVSAHVEKDTYAPEDTDAMIAAVQENISTHTKDMTDEQRTAYTVQVALQFFRALLPAIAIFGGLLWVIGLLGKAYFLTLFTKKTMFVSDACMQSVRHFPGLLCVWFLQWFQSFLWLLYAFALLAAVSPLFVFGMIVTVPLVLWLYPRLLFAPIIYLEERVSVTQSIRLSYRRTKKKWWKVVFPLIGLTAVLWIVSNAGNLLLISLASAVLRYSAYAEYLYWLTPFLVLILIVYRLAFIVEMKKDVGHGG